MKAILHALVLLFILPIVARGEVILSTPDALMVHPASLRNIHHSQTNKDNIQFFGDTNILVFRVRDGVVFADLDTLLPNKSPEVLEAEGNFSQGYDYWWSPALKRLDQLTVIEPHTGISDMALFPDKHLLATAGFLSSTQNVKARTVSANYSTRNNIALYKVFPEKRQFYQVAGASIGGEALDGGKRIYEIPNSIHFNHNGNKLVVATRTSSSELWPNYHYDLPRTRARSKSLSYILAVNESDEYSMTKRLSPLEAGHGRVHSAFFSQKPSVNRVITSFRDGLIGFRDIRTARWRKRYYLGFNEASGAVTCRRRAGRFAPNPHLDEDKRDAGVLLYAKETASANYLVAYPDYLNAYAKSVTVLTMKPVCPSVLFTIDIENRPLNPRNCNEPSECDWYDRNNGRPVTIAMHPSEQHDLLLYSPSYNTEKDEDRIPPVEFTMYDLKASGPGKPAVIAKGSIAHLFHNPFHTLYSYARKMAGSEFHPTKKLVASTVGLNHIVLWTWHEDQSIEIVAKIISKNLRGHPYQEIKFSPVGDLLVSTSTYETEPATEALITEVWDISDYLHTIPDLAP